MSTIAAISTPQGTGGISVIRISGESAFEIADRVFKPSKGSVLKMSANTCKYGKIVSADETILDDGVVTVFKSPNSYTGEDTCEISCHGGIYVTRRILREIFKAGAVPASAGEFTKRAFLNGKLSLTQAEAVMDLISANGSQTLNSAVNARQGRLYKQIKQVSDRLVTILGELAAWVDYPEEDLPEADPVALENSIDSAISVLERILKNYDSGKVLRDGIDTAIVGKANVGKSTLMNNILGFERSIVTDIEGTTRDIVEETARVGEILLRLSDTAGLRETGDIIENMGIELSRKKLDTAQLVIAVFDSSSPLDSSDLELLERIKNKKTLIVLNKTDLEQKLFANDFSDYSRCVVEISAKNEGTDKIANALEEMFLNNDFDPHTDFFANERQHACTEKAYEKLIDAKDSLLSGISLDCVSVTLESALESLLELAGERVTDAVVDDVFSRFCVGK